MYFPYSGGLLYKTCSYKFCKIHRKHLSSRNFLTKLQRFSMQLSLWRRFLSLVRELLQFHGQSKLNKHLTIWKTVPSDLMTEHHVPECHVEDKIILCYFISCRMNPLETYLIEKLLYAKESSKVLQLPGK